MRVLIALVCTLLLFGSAHAETFFCYQYPGATVFEHDGTDGADEICAAGNVLISGDINGFGNASIEDDVIAGRDLIAGRFLRANYIVDPDCVTAGVSGAFWNDSVSGETKMCVFDGATTTMKVLGDKHIDTCAELNALLTDDPCAILAEPIAISEADGSPSFSTNIIQLDQVDGYTLTNAAGVAVLDFKAASVSQQGAVSIAAQVYAGRKQFRDGSEHGPSPTLTPTPTATGVTPTPTGVTPTPTASRTPQASVWGDLKVQRDLRFEHLGSPTVHLIQPMTAPRHHVIADYVQIGGGNCSDSGSGCNGGWAALTGGIGTVLGTGGSAVVEGGAGFSGSDVELKPVFPFSGSTSGKTKIGGHATFCESPNDGPPTVSACGAGPSVSASSCSNMGTVTAGTGVLLTSCTLTFARPFPASSVLKCWANNRSTIQFTQAVPAAGGASVTLNVIPGNVLASDVIDYFCAAVD